MYWYKRDGWPDVMFYVIAMPFGLIMAISKKVEKLERKLYVVSSYIKRLKGVIRW